MTLVPWDAKFEDVLRATLPMLEPTSRIEPQTRLAEHGLDDVLLTEVVDRLEETYCVSLPPDALFPAESATPGSVWEVLQASVQELWADELVVLPAA
jgi:acyl carrier protein